MSTPEKPRPSLDDTLNRIDEAIDALAADMAAQPDCRRCARQSLIGYELCAYHLQLEPRAAMIEDLGPAGLVTEPVVRDGDTVTLTQPGVYEMTWNPGGSGEPSIAERAADPDPALVRQAVVAAIARGDVHRAARQSAAQLAATVERINAARPKQPPPTEPERGWLARALHRLFG